jgi:threonine aldolase
MPTPDEAAAAQRRSAALAGCTRWLSGHGDITPADWLKQAAASVQTDRRDTYGEGGEVEALEAEVKELLGKPAAVFMPSGIMAQQAALRSWCDRIGFDAVSVHALSHIVADELNALNELHGVRMQVLTTEPRPSTVDDLNDIAEPLAAVCVELPLRNAGFLLPEWDDLVALSTAVRARGAAMHVDGARIWESQPYYDRRLAEIATLADTIYVSFYKGLGGMAGAVLAGPEDVIAQARRWQRRHGGQVFSLLPYAALARHGLRTYLPHMGEYHARAKELAIAFGELDGVRILPAPPQTNSFRIFADVPHTALKEAWLRCMEAEHIATPFWHPTDVPGWSYAEVAVGAATLAWPVAEQVATVGRVLDAARENARG